MDLLTTTLLHYFKDIPIILVSGLYFSLTKLFYQGHDLVPVGIVIKSGFSQQSIIFLICQIMSKLLSGNLKLLEYLEKDQKVRF